MQAPSLTCPACQSELRLPVEERCPICLEFLPPDIQQAAKVAARATVATEATPMGPPPRPMIPSIPVGDAAPQATYTPWPAPAAPPAPPALPRSAPTPSVPWQSGPAPTPMPFAPMVTPAMLGAAEEMYKGATSGATVSAIITGIAGILSILIATSSASTAGFCATLAVIACIACIACIVTAATNSRKRLYLHQAGLGLVRGAASELIRYEDVKNVWVTETDAAPPVNRPFLIELTSGRRISLKAGDYADGPRLAASLANRLRASLVSRAMAEIRAGRPVTFGGVRVDGAAISAGGQSLPWAAVDGARARGGAIQINQRGAWTPWAPITTETPNTLALPGIASAIRGLPPPP